MSPSFESHRIANGLLADHAGDAFPSLVSGWRGACLELRAFGTHFGYVHEGRAILNCAAGSFPLGAGMYFCVPGEGTVSGDGCGLVVSRCGFHGLFQLGGPVEASGRLKYIDGCTDTLLVGPVMKGDPCLNLLAFPPGVRQTLHTHPSLRAGIVASGAGWCVTASGRARLAPGQAFVIPADALHGFVTDEQPMRIVAYHPDSDFGPTHEDHPMINRTLVDGLSASYLDDIRTK